METPQAIQLCRSLREARERNITSPVVMILWRGCEAASAIWKYAFNSTDGMHHPCKGSLTSS